MSAPMVNGMTPASRAMRAALKLMWPPRPTSMRTPRAMASKISGCTLPSRDTNAPGLLRERMREDVAGVEERQRVVDDGVGIDRRPGLFPPEPAEVHVDRHLGRARRFLPQAQRLDAPARVAADLCVALDARDEVAVLLDGVDRFLDVDPVRTVEADMTMPEEAAHEVVRDESIDARHGRVLDELSEALDGERSGAALVDDNGHTRANANLVRV